jgi:6-phosphogluconolactonase
MRITGSGLNPVPRLLFYTRMKLPLPISCVAVCFGLLLTFGVAGLAAEVSAQSALVYFGTYTGPKSQGIYVSHLDPTTGLLTAPELAGAVSSPSFVAIHPSHQFLYAVNEVSTFQGKKAGAVTAFAIEPRTGKLTLLNQQSSGGSGPCHLNVDRTGRNVLVANYGGGSCAVLPIDQDGRIGAATTFIQHRGSSMDKRRQEGPHAHGAYFDPANRFAFVPDLGLDHVMIYKFDPAQGSLVANEPPFGSVPPGSGPRHLAFDPTGKYVYVINEMLCTVTAFTYDAARGSLAPIHTVSTLPSGEQLLPSFSTAELEVHPSGRFLYGSNRGHDTIAVFAIDQQTGRLTPIQHQSTQGKTPRGFGIDPTGRWLFAANQDSDTVVGFRIDENTGRLSPTGQTVHVGMPVCVRIWGLVSK